MLSEFIRLLKHKNNASIEYIGKYELMNGGVQACIGSSVIRL